MLNSQENSAAILVGVGNREIDHPLMAITANDAKRIGQEFVSRCRFQHRNTLYLLNEEATCARFIAGLDDLASKTKDSPLDIVVIYFSGHGCVIADKYYLVLRDTENSNISATAIDGNLFVEKLQRINCDKMLILLDCCHAGGMTHSVDIPFNKQLFLNSNFNRIVLTASHAAQLSYVSTPLSLFTFAFIEGLSGKYFQKGDKSVTIFDLAMYVRERVYHLSGKEQQPQLNVLQKSYTRNYILVEYENDNPPLPFEDSLILRTKDGKQINTGLLAEIDEDYREQFKWMLENGRNNILIENINDSSVNVKIIGKIEQHAGNNIINIDKIEKAEFS